MDDIGEAFLDPDGKPVGLLTGAKTAPSVRIKRCRVG